MVAFVRFFQRNLVWFIPIAMGIGLVYGNSFSVQGFKHAVIPVTFIMIFPMMVTLNFKSIFVKGDLGLQIGTQVINFVAIPALAYGVIGLFFNSSIPKEALWGVGLFLVGVLPTSGMTISWTGFAGGNKEAATKMVVFGLVLGALAAPVYTKLFMGATIDVNMLDMFKKILLVVFAPLLMGLIIQKILIRKFGQHAWDTQIKQNFGPFSALGVILIAFVAMSLKAKSLIASPGDLIRIVIPILVFYTISYAVLSLLGAWLFKAKNAIAMVFGVVMRDLSIALAIAMTSFGEAGATIAVLIALCYVVQIQTAAWYVKLTPRLFRPPEFANLSSGPIRNS